MKRLSGLLAIIILFALPLSAAQAATLGFAPAANYGLGSYPISVAVGDFNGDTWPDLVTANPNSNDVSVRWNDGDGTFDDHTATYAVGAGPYSVAVGDFNGDTWPDLATANVGANNVSVLWNDGDGTFDDHPATYAIGSYPTSVAVGDFNWDGKPDLVTANAPMNDVSVLYNDGDGTFDDYSPSYSVGSGPTSVAVGDFNWDGLPDLATANPNSNDVSVLLNEVGTFFNYRANYGMGSGTYSVAVEDFNGDGWLDLATANPNSNNVSVRWNDGDGTFDDYSAAYSVGSGTYSAAVGDFNGDGKPDLVAANYDSDNVSVLYNDGDGTFDDYSAAYSVGSGPLSVAVGDFNGDSQPDLVTANYDSGYVSVLLNTLIGQTETNLAALPVSPTYGETLTLTATVTADIPGTPTGEVQFKDNGVNLGAPVSLTDDQATYTTSALGAGDHSLTAEFLANEDYNGSTSDPQTVTVSKAPLTITVDDKDKVYGARFPAFTLSYSRFVNGETSSVLGGQFVLITSAHWYDNVGNYPVEADGLTSDNYDITFVPGTLHILPKPLTVTADNATKVYGDPLPAFTASYSGFVMGQNQSVLGGTLTFSTEATQTSPVSTYAVTPGGRTSSNYNITFVDGTLTITATDTTMTLDSSTSSSTYGTPVTFTATISPASAGGTVTFKADDSTITGCGAQEVTSGQATCTTSTITSGWHVITAEYSGDVNHNPSSARLSPDLQVNKATATITLGSLTQTYDGTPKSATATTSPEGLTVSFMYNGSLFAPTNAGTYAVDAAIIDPNYEGSTSGVLTIEKANVIITFGNLIAEYDGNQKAATFTTDPPGLAVNLTYDGSSTLPSAVGTYELVGTTSDMNHEGTATASFIIRDTTPPVVTSFLVPASSSTLDVPIDAFTATDLNGVNGFLVTQSATPPSAGAGGWSSPAPGAYHVIATGTYTLYPWARDNANNVSAVFSSPRTILVCYPTVVVTSTDDSGPGSLRQAITDVCANGTITFDASLAGQTIRLTSATLTLSKNVTIDGSSLTLQITISGDANDSGAPDTGDVQVFFVNSGVTANLNKLAIVKGYGAMGGGLHNEGTTTITNCTVTNNASSIHGGGLVNMSGGSLTVSGCTIANNIINGAGGGILNYGQLTVTNTTISGNVASGGGGGGGLYTQAGAGPTVITNSTFTDNVYRAILNYRGNLVVKNSTFDNNTDAAIYSNLETTPYAVTVTNSTFNQNTVALVGYTGSLTVTNSILANSTAANCAGTITNGGNNLQFGGTVANSCGATIPTFDPQLSALGSYGGSTQTFALLPGSAAIDAGSAAACAAAPASNLDQRGMTRPQGDRCDIGAFESGGFTFGSLTGTPQDAAVNAAFAAPLGLTVTANNAGEPVMGGKVTFSPPTSGASTVITGSPATIASDGTVSVTATANGTAGGPYNVTARASGATSVDFALTNNKGTATITLVNLTQEYDGTLKSVTAATVPAGLNVSVTYDPTSTINAGSYTVEATIEDPNYQGTATGTLVVDPRPITVTAASDSKTYDGTIASTAIPTITSGNLVGSDTATWTQTFDTPNAGIGKTLTPAGAVNDGTGGNNYAITFNPINTGVITKADATITFGSLDYTYNGLPHSATVTTVPEGLTVTYTYNGSSIPPINAGNYTVMATIVDPNYQGSESGTLSIAPAALTVTADNASKLYGGFMPTFTVHYDGFVLAEDPSALGGILSITTPATTSSDVGTYAITPSGLTSINYAITFVDGTLTVTPAPLTVTADDKTKDYRAPLPTFTASFSGFVLGQNPSVLSGTLAFSTTATRTSPAGTYPVTPGGLTSTNYSITFKDGTLTVVDVIIHTLADFDGDGDSDLSVYKVEPWGGMWYLQNQSAHLHGDSASLPISCDYNGDGTTDVAIYTAGTWDVEGLFVDTWGDANSIPIPADYDGDGSCELAVYKVEASEGVWYIQDMGVYTYGNSESIPVPADYNNDGILDIAVYNAGTWYVKDQFVDTWGDANSFPLPTRDTNGDGKPH